MNEEKFLKETEKRSEELDSLFNEVADFYIKKFNEFGEKYPITATDFFSSAVAFVAIIFKAIHKSTGIPHDQLLDEFIKLLSKKSKSNE